MQCTGERKGARRVCARCGELYGAYEPVIVIAAGEPDRRTSVVAAGAGGEETFGEQRVLHERCYKRSATG